MQFCAAAKCSYLLELCLFGKVYAFVHTYTHRVVEF